MNAASIVLRPAQAIFAAWIALFILILANGYTLNLLWLPADAAAVLVLVLIQASLLARWLAVRHVRIAGDALELAGFLLVVVGVWIYFVYPALPTLLPPSYSGDPALHYAFTSKVFATGRIIADDPGGPSLIAATLAHWLGQSPLRVMHPVAALWLALTAGGIYGIACAILPDRKESKVVALGAVFALFVAWNYFAGLALGANYFFSQIAGQLFIVAFVWVLCEYRESEDTVWEILLIGSLLSVGVLYPLWIGLPGALLAWEMVDAWRRNEASRARTQRTARLAVIAALVVGAAFLLNGRQFIPTLGRIQLGGTVLGPTLDALGGPLLVLCALAGLLIARGQERLRVVVALTVFTLLQTLALLGTRVFLGGGQYWFNKSFFLWIFPLALCAVIALARAMDWLSRLIPRRLVASAPGLITVFALLAAITLFARPAPSYAVLDESDIQVALWAKSHLNTRHVNYIGSKSLTGLWLGVGLWEEELPGDLLADLAALGPKTFEEWYDAPGWGEYVFVSSRQKIPAGLNVTVLYRQGDSMIAQKASTTSHPPSDDPPARFGNVLALRDYALPRQTVGAGEVLSFTTTVEARQVPPRRVAWRLTLRDSQNDSAAELQVDPFDNQFPLQRWPDGAAVSQKFRFPLPADIQPGLYDLKIGLYYVGSGDAVGYRMNDGTVDDVLDLGQVKVALPTPDLASIARVDRTFGEGIMLLGYQIEKPSPIRPGDSVNVTLYWQCLRAMPQDYSVFVHLVDEAGAMRAQHDSPPRGGTYPTSIWDRGEIIGDTHTIVVPREPSPSTYRLAVGMYAWPNLQRLPAGNGDQVVLPLTIKIDP
ncbi:MAG: hypothetical protein HY782_01910 [Chloroflexi bacterium]|nr:hypothetical protein [Chloroflexota bacterium]